jgi:hypothetical protein
MQKVQEQLFVLSMGNPSKNVKVKRKYGRRNRKFKRV